jgi:hypothetical protein
VDPTEYFTKGDPSHSEQSLWLSTTIYYHARSQVLKGTLTLKQDHMSFTSESSDANFMIDYLDMLCVRKLLIPNEESIDSQDRFVRDNYLYNIMV